MPLNAYDIFLYYVYKEPAGHLSQLPSEQKAEEF